MLLPRWRPGFGASRMVMNQLLSTASNHFVNRREWTRNLGSYLMASWIEIDRVRKDQNTFKPMAARLLADPIFERSEFADGFLENIANWKSDELSTRQGEILLELRDEAEIHHKYKGLSIPTLIEKCYRAMHLTQVVSTG
jgi:hypothetical protein